MDEKLKDSLKIKSMIEFANYYVKRTNNKVLL